MKNITFKTQVSIGIMLILIGNILALIFHKGLLSNVAWVLYGVLLILNPVYPERYRNDAKKAKIGSRIAGVICILVGTFTKYVV